ncbi:hypothetical protein [Mycolicibacterium sp.]|jgi:hypothetical protein|uniref:hypothetical protein n=1 Tax=Mycolicibacterium sp. TaxID=2320850 RepID=UPI0028A7FE6E|nr:hypothetical protein [Mycolicibacterium sp.]
MPVEPEAKGGEPARAPEPAGEPKPAEPQPAEVKPAPPSTNTPAATALPPVSVPEPDTGYTAAGVPTLGGVRDKIESRYGTALGATELAEETTEGRAASQRYEAVQQAAADKLEEIRSSMRKPD